ncbi:MAG TPA: hypothetical protein VFE30_11330 [Anaeromyxobacteraceae bacterium]|jgi:hypothetical protein|nr:hypothetical protein [Anaeromyxobacteraceae bacterium]
MTTTPAPAVHFPTPSRLAGLRGLAVLAFCAALGAGFVAETSRRPPPVQAGPVEFASADCAGQLVQARPAGHRPARFIR